jgi:hypothetical protein
MQEQSLQERFHNLSMELESMNYWMHECSQNLENGQIYEDEVMKQPMDNNNNKLHQGYATQGDA